MNQTRLTIAVMVWLTAMFAIACGSGHADFRPAPQDPCTREKGPKVCYTDDDTGELTCHQGDSK